MIEEERELTRLLSTEIIRESRVKVRVNIRVNRLNRSKVVVNAGVVEAERESTYGKERGDASTERSP